MSETYSEEIEALAESLDPKLIRYNRFESLTGATAGCRGPTGDLLCDPKAIPWTPQYFGTFHYVEVVWSRSRPDTFGIAKLVDDSWLYSEDGQVVGLVLSNLPEIVETYDLIGPAGITVPILDYPAPV